MVSEFAARGEGVFFTFLLAMNDCFLLVWHCSGDVGIGLNVRRMRDQFLSTFTTTYSLCPIGDIGTVFRCYPAMWQVFVEDPELPGRYRLAAERPSRPAGTPPPPAPPPEMQIRSSLRARLQEFPAPSRVPCVTKAVL